MKHLITLIMCVFVLGSCISDHDHDRFHLETLPIVEVIEIPDSFLHGETYEITVEYTFPNACHSFYDLYYEYDGNARIVAIISIVNDNIACTQATITKRYTFDVVAAQKEDYLFKFWKGLDDDNNDTFEEITVPVTLN